MRSILILLLIFAGLVAAASYVIGAPVIITREDQLKLALFLGDPQAAVTEPGVSFAFANEVRTFDARWQPLSSDPKEIQTLDRERIVLDNYVIWRIEEPLQFYQSFPSGQLEAETQIDQIVKGNVREVIGQKTLPEVLKDKRVEIMEEITEKSREAVARFGIGIQDVRVKRTELPAGTEENIFARMRAERDRLARKHRAEGEEEARRIRAEADREALVTVAEARGQSARERGKGDAEAARIYAEAYDADADFYEFTRSLEAYRHTIGKGTTMVLPPDHEFFKLFQEGADGG